MRIVSREKSMINGYEEIKLSDGTTLRREWIRMIPDDWEFVNAAESPSRFYVNGKEVSRWDIVGEKITVVPLSIQEIGESGKLINQKASSGWPIEGWPKLKESIKIESADYLSSQMIPSKEVEEKIIENASDLIFADEILHLLSTCEYFDPHQAIYDCIVGIKTRINRGEDPIPYLVELHYELTKDNQVDFDENIVGVIKRLEGWLKKQKVNYSSWPLGQIPEHLRRPELEQIRKMGYQWEDAREIVGILEKRVAEFSGSKYAVAVDCASHGLFLCLKYLKATGDITIPKRTYCSVPQQIIHAGCSPVLEDLQWSGVYQLKPYPIYDAAVRWKRDAYKEFEGSLYVISFQLKKIIPNGKMGIILCNDEDAYKKLKLMSYDGRDLALPYTDPEHVKCLGYHMYATPEDCARTLILMDSITREGDSGNDTTYPDLTGWMNNWI